MSKYLSRTLRAIAYLWAGFPAIFALFALLALNIDPTGLIRMALSPAFWFISLVSIAAGMGILTVRWYGWYLFLFSNFLASYETAVVLANYSRSQYRFFLFAATALVQLALIFIVGREVRVPYYFPRIRWWETDPRYKLSLQTKLTRNDNSEVEGLIMDISFGGCFIKTHATFPNEEPVRLNFVLFDQPVECRGKVVWASESTVTHPRGIGIKFTALSRDTAFILRQGVRKLRKLARVYTQIARERNYREYLQREERYQGKNPK